MPSRAHLSATGCWIHDRSDPGITPQLEQVREEMQVQGYVGGGSPLVGKEWVRFDEVKEPGGRSHQGLAGILESKNTRTGTLSQVNNSGRAHANAREHQSGYFQRKRTHRFQHRHTAAKEPHKTLSDRSDPFRPIQTSR